MKLNKLLIAVVFITICTSCKKSFLDDVNNGSILLRQDYVTNLKATNEYLNGVYTETATVLFHGNAAIYPDLIADNIKVVIGSGGTAQLGFHYNWNQQADETLGSGGIISSSNLNCNAFSYGAYKIIRAANFVLEKSEEYKNENAATADAMKGQAYAIRALTHFMLVNFFAQSYNFTNDGSHPGVAYITSSNWTSPVPGRNTVAEVYSSLVSDLNNAIALLPQTSSGKLFISKNASKALLARVYLFKGDWFLAKNLAREVCTAVPIMTVNYPARLFTSLETEALFQIPASSGALNSYQTNFASTYFRGTARFQATSDISVLLNEDPADLRKVWITPSASNWNIVKFPVDVIPEVSGSGSYYHTVIRSSEMYLTAAEAYAQINNVDSARFYLDAIRKRANPAVLASTSVGSALLDAIYRERRKELAFESLRMFDLLRWKKGVNRIDALSTVAQNLPYPSNKAIAPIPGMDVKVSGFSQNLDY
jgi:starch-binding outer membrane protein, SusD/RagB family